MSWISKWWPRRPEKQTPSILQRALDNQKQRKKEEAERPVYKDMPYVSNKDILFARYNLTQEGYDVSRPQPVYLSTVAPPDAEKLKELLKEWHKQPMLFTPATPVYDWDAIESDYMKANMEMAIKRGSGFLAYETVEWFKLRITGKK